MADTALVDLTTGTPASTDIFYIIKDPSGTPLDRKVALSALLDWIEANGAAPSSFLSSGTLGDARVAESNVTQHEAALTLTESQISDLGTYLEDISGESLADLADVDDTVATPSDGDIIVYRSAGSDWVLEAKPAGGSNPALSDVTDVTITTVADNEVLAYDNGTSEWINQTAAEAGLAAATHAHTESDITDLGTYQVELAEGQFDDGDKTKLDTVESNADVTDAANVETAIEAISLTAVSGATGDEVLIVDATDGGLKAVLWENLPSGGSGGDEWGDAVDADIVPDADGTRDLGSTSNRFAELHVDSIDLNGTTLDGTTLSDPGADRLLFWDDSESTTDWLTAGAGLSISTTTITVDASLGGEVNWDTISDVTDASAFESGDKVLIFEAGVGMRKVDYTDLPGAGGGLSNIVEDTTPQLGGDLDLNGNDITGMVIGTDIQAFDADTLKADTTDELTVGYTQSIDDHGEVTTGTITPAFADSNIQTIENGGAFTLAPPASGNGVITLEITNNASAGAITTSGFSSVTGDSFTTTDADIFLCSVAKIGSNSYLNVVAHAGNA